MGRKIKFLVKITYLPSLKKKKNVTFDMFYLLATNFLLPLESF